MIRTLVAYTATLSLLLGVRGQPIECQFDDQCQSGFYCVSDAFVCQRCLNCELLKRDPSRAPSTCIKSVAECGSCIKGLVEDLRGDVSAECVQPDPRGDASSPSVFVWVAVAIGLLLFLVLVAVILICLLRNTYTYKILASMRTSVQSQGAGAGAAAGAGAGGVASAPELPPAYEAHYSAARAPEPPRLHDYCTQHNGEESSWPFIKRAPSTRVSEARESAGSQAARVYNNPNYVRGPHMSSAYDGAGVTAAGAGDAVPSDDERDAFVHDEDTMESTWSPAVLHDGNGNAVTSTSAGVVSGATAAGELAGLLVPARPAPLCARQDNNSRTDSNRNPSEALGAGENSTSGASNNMPSFIINVVQSINAVQQQNDVTL
ncbi:uncharacterized protein LOC125077754 [Vanessa atalanta]|uniref:uncharacterized protein LOC125077754 n=1 Tax=Vanessa atalanta TaxID=42275 RepID=UPI001FCE0228|nr:uncharacterized protein LOC125077754 [Vanessa atalanta]